VGDRGAIAWSARDGGSVRPGSSVIPPRERFIPWVAAFIAGLVLFTAQEVLAHLVSWH
jgi:hypothetical protein